MEQLSQRRVRFGMDGTIWVGGGDLQEAWTEATELNPLLLAQTRRYYGRALSPETIEQTIRRADLGYMRDLTDLIYETMRIDPHFFSVTSKRMRALAGMRPQVVAASGDGIDPQLAELCAEMVRQQLKWIPNLHQTVQRLNWAHCYGRAALEKVWRQNPAGSQVAWRIDRLNWIHPRRLSFGPERELRVRDDVFDGIAFAPRGIELRKYPLKFISSTPQLFNDYPEREGFGPSALYWCFFKRFSWRERLVLLEVFGRPWRIAYSEEQWVSRDRIEEAAKAVDALAGNATGAVPPGVKIDSQSPPAGAGANHRDTAVDADDQISKLVLGQTRTTDSKAEALGSNATDVAQAEQDEIKDSDALDISDVLTEQLAVDIVALNIGADAVDHAPRIEIAYDRGRDPTVELGRAKTLIVDLGQPVKREELYERAGFSMPQPGDDIAEAPAQPALPGLGDLGLPGPNDGGVPGPDANPLGEGGAVAPDTQQMSQRRDELAVLRAVRALALLEQLSGRR